MAKACLPFRHPNVSGLFASTTSLPEKFPTVASALLDLTPTESTKTFTRLLKLDMAFTNELMEMADKTFYCGVHPLPSVNRFTDRIGISALRCLILRFSLKKTIFSAQQRPELLEQLYHHSTSAAYIAQLVAQHASINREHVFFLGMLQDVGLAAGLQQIPASYNDVTALSMLIPTHGPVAAMLAAHWKLPKPVQDLLMRHHTLSMDGRNDPYIASLMIAEHLVDRITLALPSQLHPPPNAPELAAAMETLTIDESDIQRLLEQAQKVIQRI